MRINGGSGSGEKRTLIYLPILHTQADMGSLGESVQRETLRKLGRIALRRKDQAIAEVWIQIEQVIAGLALDYQKTRLYQDGLPVCGREEGIVQDLARRGSRNHELLVQLMAQGATLMGTESAELLQQEYELVKRSLGAGPTSAPAGTVARQKALSQDLLNRRDRYIAARINATLRAGETGILFLGMLHSLKNWLDQDIRVIYPLRPPLEG